MTQYRPTSKSVIMPQETTSPVATTKRVRKSKPAAEAKATASVPSKVRLLKVASAEFAERGFAGARIGEIARKAQINKQLIYHYFGGKQQLYAAVLTDMVGRLQLGTDIEEAQTSSRPQSALERSLGLFEAVRGPVGRQWIRLLMFEALETSGAIHLEEARRRVYKRGVETIRAAQKTGEIDPAFDPEALRVALFGFSLIPVLLPQIAEIVTDQNPQDAAFAERWTRLLEELYSRLKPVVRA